MFDQRAPIIPRFACSRRPLLFAALPAAIVLAALALACGVLFVTTMAVRFALLVHGFFHHFHVELDDEPK